MSAPFNRRQAAQLGAVVLVGWALGRVVLRTDPNVRDLGHSSAAANILQGVGSPTSGPTTASVRLAVFTDYLCPACRRAFPELVRAVHSDGDVRIIYKDWPIFGPVSERAARLALATNEQGIYPAVHRQLMSGRRIDDDRMLRQVVTDAGGDWKRAIAYMMAHEQSIAARLHANGQEALAIGLAGTPGYLVGSQLVIGAISEGEFIDLFARARDTR